MSDSTQALIKKIKAWKTCSFVGEATLKKRVACLIGTQVQAHTNRTKNLWSIHSCFRKGECVAYADGLIILKDVCWLPAKNRAAQDTFFPKVGEGSGKRTVQAFAEGTLIYAKGRSRQAKGYGIPEIDSIIEDIAGCERFEAGYNPFKVNQLKYFRDREGRPLYQSDYALLEYYLCKETGKVKHKVFAVCGASYFDMREAELEVDAIQQPSDEYLRKRFKTEDNYDAFTTKTKHGINWKSTTGRKSPFKRSGD